MKNHLPLFIATAVLSLSPERTTATVRFDLDSKMSFHSLPHELEMEAYLGELLDMLGLPHNIPVLVDPRAKGFCAFAALSMGYHFIGVDPACVGPMRVENKYARKAQGVLGHELAHILAGHCLNRSGGAGKRRRPTNGQVGRSPGWACRWRKACCSRRSWVRMVPFLTHLVEYVGLRSNAAGIAAILPRSGCRAHQEERGTTGGKSG